MLNRDGGQWRLSWEKTANGYRGWVEKHPKHAAEAATFDEMAEQVYALVDEHLHGGEWTADWSPPPPAQPGSRGGVLESHVELVPESSFVCFQDPRAIAPSYCDSCGSLGGPRTAERLRVFVESPGNVSSCYGTAPGWLVIVSDELAKALGQLGLECEWREVIRVGRSRKKYVEPIPTRPVPRAVALKDEGEVGWRCPECQFESYYHNHQTHRTTSFYRRRELPNQKAAFWIGAHHWRLGICVASEWWKGVRSTSIARGVIAKPIGVAEDDDVDPSPQLRPRIPPNYHVNQRSRWHALQLREAKANGLDVEGWSL